ncbi:hypothetical protein PFY01_02190 [Brevundimonas vesicularis]|uniref:hypothetical protein n=2 Tax=Brevundimonas TaxID=41275 RepID=UPI0022EC3DAE|nr:hypothetical protein [Brevundimonas vesicularis]WBT06512.1 hypothetical protein PFY01_02190 [Brevundimonas vesicularis]
MSATAPPSGVPSLKWIAAVGAGAFALFLLGALVVEPALNRLIAPIDAPVGPRVYGQVEVGEVMLSGRYVAAKSDMVLDVDGGALSTTAGGRLNSAPHRLVQADQQASVSKSFTDAMVVPPMAQIEVRRVTADDDTRLCAGHPVGWLALAVRRDGFVLMPVRQGPPPGALLADDRLCAVLDLSR